MEAPELCIRKVRSGEAALLQDVAIRSYRNHYSQMWRDGGKRYLERTYARPRLVKNLADPALGYWLAYTEEGALGFLCLRFDSALPGHFSAAEGLEILQIYLVKEATGFGLGRKMVDIALEEARKRKKKGTWLKMMDSRPKVRRSYEAMGFSLCGSTRLEDPFLRQGFEGMLVLKRYALPP